MLSHNWILSSWICCENNITVSLKEFCLHLYYQLLVDCQCAQPQLDSELLDLLQKTEIAIIICTTLYVSLVRPHLEYASEIWNPYLTGDIQTLEKVQRCATKLVPELKHLEYINRLIPLNLPSLLHRR